MRKLGRPLVIFVAALCVGPLIAWLLGSFLVVEKPLERADAIVVLSGSAEFEERCDTAAELFHRNVADKIFLTDDGNRSGWDSEAQRNPLFVERATRRLVELGVEPESIEIIAGPVQGTADEARVFAQTAKERRLTSVMLVTSAYHTRRARWTFERASAGTIKFGITSPPAVRITDGPCCWWLSPERLKTVGTEYIKLGYYWWEY